MGYTIKAGSTTSINAGGQYDNSTNTSSAVFENTLAVAAANASLSAESAAADAITATTQAGIATTGATTATTQAGIATTGASTATTQAGIATTAATTAVTQAGIATTGGTTATTQAGIATTGASTATTQAGIATAAATTATTQAGIAGTAATSASTSMSQSSNYASQAITAWGASMSPAETLPTISKTLHSGNIVKAIIYDTSKDSDGGTWRKRCTDKSWYTESLGFTGTWGGQAANVAAGWAACGAVVGGAYQNTTDGKFYTPTSSTTQTEIFRGNVREFPEQVAIVAESARLVIYDLTQVGTPPWMVFSLAALANFWGSANSATCLGITNGKLIVGGSGLRIADFSKDSMLVISSIATNGASQGISTRNGTVSWTIPNSIILVNATVNDCAITVLDTAPIDPATGLPVPTIAVATAGGVSVIKDDGTVVNSSLTVSIAAVAIRGLMLAALRAASAQNAYTFADIRSIGASFVMQAYSPSSTPAILDRLSGNGAMASGVQSLVSNSERGITLLKENPATPTKGMVSYITNAYNTGWLPGDIRGAYLADTTAETITASGELVTNGTFTTDTTGWTAIATASLSVVANRMRITSAASSDQARQTITTVIGKTYQITVEMQASAGGTYLNAGGIATTALAAGARTEVLTFVATSTSTYIALVNNFIGTADYDNISVKLADPDRSVKNTGLILNGSLNKTAVASGAGLVAYSGFSAANYIEQPYNANLDFGTGDFCVMGWFKVTAISQFLFERSDIGFTGARIECAIDPSGGLYFGVNGTSIGSASTGSVIDGAYRFVTAVRRSGVCELWINGSLTLSGGGSSATVTNTAAITRLGIRAGSLAGAATTGSLALWRISATAPSADQIAHIYRTELPLFQANAQCTLAGTSTAVTALAYDDVADTLHVGTSWGRTAFRDLLRVESEVTTTGALTSLSTNQGAVLTGGTSAKFYQPAMLLRDELRRKDVARKALGKVPVFLDFTATASQTAFVLPKGYTAKALYKNGTLMREATTGTYWSRSNDGFQETATLSAGATVSDWVSIMALRAN